jgi:hypothetical protein
MNPYPVLTLANEKDILEVLRVILQERRKDVRDFDNLNARFYSKNPKVPTSSTDISSSDKVGDIGYDNSYIYVCVNNAGTAEWRRAALTTW